jgi:hypothetical protein
MKTLRLLLPFLLLAGLFGIQSCSEDNDSTFVSSTETAAYSADVALEWYKLFEEIDRYAPGYRPPAAARALGYIGLAGYEAAVPGMPDHQSLYKHLSGYNPPVIETGSAYHWPTAVNAAYASMLRHFYPHIDIAQLNRISQLEASFENQFKTETEEETFTRSRIFGEQIADAVYGWSTTDGAGHNAYLNPRPSTYTPPIGPGLWSPTKPDFTPALFPYWGQVRTFALKGADLVARPPLPFSEDPASPFYTQARETMIWVNEIKAGKDEEGHWIAEFWSDDFGGVTFTPAGRWIAIARQVLELEQSTLDVAVELYAKMGMALCDAGVAVWNSKYIYNVERPVAFINRNFDPTWETIMNNPVTGVTGITPEFPAYPSGHSGFGGAGATALTDIFGYNYRFTDNCHKDRTEFRGTPRTFNTFIDMAVENAYSRIPIGVHFRMDCDEGLRQGYLAGQRVLQLPWRK